MNRSTRLLDRPGPRVGVSRSGIDVITAIIVLTAVVFVLQRVIHNELSPGAEAHFYQLFALSREGLLRGWLWQLFTHAFLHGIPSAPLLSLVHIGVNMLLVYSAGKALITLIGQMQTLLLYAVGAAVSGAAQVAAHPVSLVGASGAAFALVLAFTTLAPDERLDVFILAVPVRMRAANLGRGILIANVIFVALNYLPERKMMFLPQMAHVAHLAGSLVGVVYVAVVGARVNRSGRFREHRRKSSDPWSW